MSDILQLARERAISYRECGPSAEHTAAMLNELASHVERLRAELAAAIKQRDEAREWLRYACDEIARIETRFYWAVTPQQIAERNGWDCFGEKEGGGA